MDDAVACSTAVVHDIVPGQWPGMFVRVRLLISEPHRGLLVSERALGTDQGQEYVYVVDQRNLVQYRRVSLGPLQSDGLPVVQQGLRPGEWVLVSGLQRVRPGVEVWPERIATGSQSQADAGLRWRTLS